MLFDTLINDKENYPHLAYLSKGDYELLLNTEDFFVVHFTENGIYSVEISENCGHEAFNQTVSFLKELGPTLIETTNKEIYSLLHGNFKNSYGCIQYCLGNVGISDEKLTLLKPDDLDFAIKNYSDADYLHKLFSNNQILGYYDNDELIGYILRHVDGTLGALYVIPDRRCNGFGSKITQAAVAYFNDPLAYSQVIDNNMASIQMHVRMNATKCSKKIYWLYNNGFSY